MAWFFTGTFRRLFCAVVVLSLFFNRAYAQISDFRVHTVADSVNGENGFLVSYEQFANGEMKDAYTNMFGFHFERLAWTWGKIGLRLTAGLVGGEGTGLRENPAWQVETADLGFWALTAEAIPVYRFNSGNAFSQVTPFVGAGVGLYGATEKFSVMLQRSESVVKGDASALRGAVTGNALVGLYVPVNQDYSLQLELKAIISTRGGFTDLLSGDQKDLFKANIYPVVKRPAFDLSGYNLSVVMFM